MCTQKKLIILLLATLTGSAWADGKDASASIATKTKASIAKPSSTPKKANALQASFVSQEEHAAKGGAQVAEAPSGTVTVGGGSSDKPQESMPPVPMPSMPPEVAKTVPEDPSAPIVKAGGGVIVAEGTGRSITKRAPAPSAAGLREPLPGASPLIPIFNAPPAQDPGKAPVSSTGLPGLGSPPGAAAPLKPIVIHAQSGINEMVPVSNLMPNRIATPFHDPQVVDFSKSQIQSIGSSIYVIPKGTQPIGIFITDSTPGSPTVALTLVPKAIPGQTVLVNIDGGYRPERADRQDNEAAPNEYVDHLRYVMKQLIREKTPTGFTETNLETGAALVGNLRIVPERQYSGQSLDLYRYRIINAGKEPVELTEESFYQKGVKAVSFFPNIRLDPWQSTKVFIINGKVEEVEGGDE